MSVGEVKTDKREQWATYSNASLNLSSTESCQHGHLPESRSFVSSLALVPPIAYLEDFDSFCASSGTGSARNNVVGSMASDVPISSSFGSSGSSPFPYDRECQLDSRNAARALAQKRYRQRRKEERENLIEDLKVKEAIISNLRERIKEQNDKIEQLSLENTNLILKLKFDNWLNSNEEQLKGKGKRNVTGSSIRSEEQQQTVANWYDSCQSEQQYDFDSMYDADDFNNPMDDEGTSSSQVMKAHSFETPFCLKNPVVESNSNRINTIKYNMGKN